MGTLTKHVLPAFLMMQLVPGLAAAGPVEAKLDAAKIEQATGLKGAFNAKGDVFKVAQPRQDIHVTVDAWAYPPFMGLGSWAAFTPMKDGNVMVMGDSVLLQDEVGPAMDAALENGLEVTALHNHFFYDDPRVYFMHISGLGSQEALAAAVGKVFAQVKAVRSGEPKPAGSFGGVAPKTNSITAAAIDEIFGVKGSVKDGMLKTVFANETYMHGVSMGADMGVNTWAAFGGTDENAVTDGDFAVREGELQAVLKALRHGGIHIVAIHHHMSGEEPRILFLHFWGRGKSRDLARSLQSALKAQEEAAKADVHDMEGGDD